MNEMIPFSGPHIIPHPSDEFTLVFDVTMEFPAAFSTLMGVV